MKAVILSSLVFLLSCGVEDTGCKWGSVEYKLIDKDKTLIERACINNEIVETEVKINEENDVVEKIGGHDLVISHQTIGCLPYVNYKDNKRTPFYDYEDPETKEPTKLTSCKVIGNIGEVNLVYVWDSSSNKWVKLYMASHGGYFRTSENSTKFIQYLPSDDSDRWSEDNLINCDLEGDTIVAGNEYKLDIAYTYELKNYRKIEGYPLCLVTSIEADDKYEICERTYGIKLDYDFDGKIDKEINGFIINKYEEGDYRRIVINDDDVVLCNGSQCEIVVYGQLECDRPNHLGFFKVTSETNVSHIKYYSDANLITYCRDPGDYEENTSYFERP